MFKFGIKMGIATGAKGDRRRRIYYWTIETVDRCYWHGDIVQLFNVAIVFPNLSTLNVRSVCLTSLRRSQYYESMMHLAQGSSE